MKIEKGFKPHLLKSLFFKITMERVLLCLEVFEVVGTEGFYVGCVRDDFFLGVTNEHVGRLCE